METKIAATDRPVSIHYINQSEVTGYQNLGNGQCNVWLNSDWKLINTTIGTIELQETPEETNAGMVYKTQLTAKHPGHETETPQQIADLSGRRVMLKVTYKSGKEKIIGGGSNGPKLNIRTLSNTSTVLIVDCNWSSAAPNLFLALQVDSGSGGGGI